MGTSIKLILRTDKQNKDGESPIYFRIIKNRRSTNLYAGIRLKEQYWDNNNKLVKTNHPNSARMNNLLRKKEIKLRDDLMAIEADNLTINVKSIREQLLNIDKVDFFSVADSIVKGYYSRGQIGTYDQRRTVIQKLKEYCKSEKLRFADFDTAFLKKYRTYLIEKKGNSVNTVYNNLKFIRQVFNAAIREGYVETKNNPFNRIKLNTVRTTKEYLMQHEIEMLELLDLETDSRIAKHRDMFVFACYACGLRISDILLLKWKHVSGNRLNITVQKTGTQVSVYVPKKALEILNKYKPSHKDLNQFIFQELPKSASKAQPLALDKAISRVTAIVNKNLKTIALKAGIDKRISFHVSRHSFATNALRKGIPIEHVQKLLGHANIRETLIYAKIVNADLDESMKVFDE